MRNSTSFMHLAPIAATLLFAAIASPPCNAKTTSIQSEYLPIFEQGKTWNYNMKFCGWLYPGEQFDDWRWTIKVDGTKNIDGKDYLCLYSETEYDSFTEVPGGTYPLGFVREDTGENKVYFILDGGYKPRMLGSYLYGQEAGQELVLYDFNAPGCIWDQPLICDASVTTEAGTFNGFGHFMNNPWASMGMFGTLGILPMDEVGNLQSDAPMDIFGGIAVQFSGRQGYIPYLCSIVAPDGTVLLSIPENETGGIYGTEADAKDIDIEVTVTPATVEISGHAELGNVVLVNAQGVTVHSSTTNEHSLSPPTAALPHGIYVVKVAGAVKKIVI